TSPDRSGAHVDSHHLLQTAVVFLLATVIMVPLTKRFRLGAVLGYLLAVVLMLFVIGLELSPQRLWVMRRSVFGTGLLQVLVSMLAISMVAYYLFGLT